MNILTMAEFAGELFIGSENRFLGGNLGIFCLPLFVFSIDIEQHLSLELWVFSEWGFRVSACTHSDGATLSSNMNACHFFAL